MEKKEIEVKMILRRYLHSNYHKSQCDSRNRGLECCIEKDDFIYFISQELDKAREEGRREQQRLDCELYGTAVATNEEIEEKWNLSKLKNNDNMEVKEKMSEDFIRGYNEAIRDILAKRGMWAGADKKLLKELSNYLKEEK